MERGEHMYLQSKIQTLLLQDGFYTIKNQFFWDQQQRLFLVSNRCVSVWGLITCRLWSFSCRLEVWILWWLIELPLWHLSHHSTNKVFFFYPASYFHEDCRDLELWNNLSTNSCWWAQKFLKADKRMGIRDHHHKAAWKMVVKWKYPPS